MKNVPINLSNLKSKVDKLDFDKLVPIPVDLSKINNIVKMMLLKKWYIMMLLKKRYIMLRLKLMKIKYLF